jgi:hypothetical protein
MRIWSLHPKYLDPKGLVALWRETLLAKQVLEGKTKGYKNHPQLYRFKAIKKPVDGINQYLSEIYIEASNRNYNFDKQKINWNFKKTKMNVTVGQLNYEASHLLNKLQIRDIKKYEALKTNLTFETHPLFNLVDGAVEKWEIINPGHGAPKQAL